ncbi:MAG TPA: cation transporter [Alphaproteobacteria bacterium]
MKARVLGAMLLALAAPAALAGERTVTLSVERMTCELCPITVAKAIERVAGVVDVAVDYQAGTAVVTFDDDVTTWSEVAAASTNAGYPAHPIQ